jgi:hypothetical protein
MATLVRTFWKLKGHLWRLWRGKIDRAQDWPAKFRRSGTPFPGLMEPVRNLGNIPNDPSHGTMKTQESVTQ